MTTLFFDTETTGTIQKRQALHDPSQPRLVSLAAALVEPQLGIIQQVRLIARPDGFIIPEEAAAVHGITTEFAMQHGISVKAIMQIFDHLCYLADQHVAFNYAFDNQIVQIEHLKAGKDHFLAEHKGKCCMLPYKLAMKIPGNYGDYKWPSLDEVCKWLGIEREGAHDAMGDVVTTIRVWYEGIRRGIIT